MNFAFICLLAVLMVYLFHQEAPSNTTESVEKDGMKWVRLTDGRLLEYGDCGDPSGEIMLYTHGFGMTGHLTTSPMYCKIAAEYGLRLISPTMPCFGLSDCYSMDNVRKISEWPADVEQILKKIGVASDSSFYAAGSSFGCMHSAAIASKMPTRVNGLLLMTPTMPVDRIAEVTDLNMDARSKLMQQLLKTPYLGEVVAEGAGRLPKMLKYEFVPDCKAALARMEQLGKHAPHWLDLRNRTIEDSARALRNTNRGLTDNMRTVAGAWDFDFDVIGDIVTKHQGKILVTSCPSDTTNPPGMQQWVASHIPHAELVTIPGNWGHFHFLLEDVWRDMLSKLVVNSMRNNNNNNNNNQQQQQEQELEQEQMQEVEE